MRQRFLLLLVVMTFFIFPAQTWAKDGFYMGMDLGVAIAPGMDVDGMDNDVSSSRCDGHINRAPMQEIQQGDCDLGNAWKSEFDGGAGVLAGLALGYRLGNFRVEGEYFFRNATHDDEVEPTFGGVTLTKATDEIATSSTKVDDVLAHNFFANLYYDYHSDSKFTPYLGIGVGVARVSLDYSGVFRRASDPNDIGTFSDPTLQSRLTNTTTVGRNKLSDTLFGYQAIAGVDYRVSEPVTIGLKFRWADFGEFESDPREWDQLRTHESSVKPGGTRVRYAVQTDDIQFWGVSLNMKYQF